MKTIVIVDIDGTISKIGERLKFLQQEPKDWDSFYNDCFEDTPITSVVELVKNMINSNYSVIFCTGRREMVKLKTSIWLHKQGIRHDVCQILMRKDGDHRHDTEVKPELLLQSHITPKDVAFILEDRASMVKKWRELGYTCFQVADGDF